MQESVVAKPSGKPGPVAGFNGAQRGRGWNFETILEINVNWLTFFGVIHSDKGWILVSYARTAFFVGTFYMGMFCTEVANLYLYIKHGELAKLPSASFLFLTHLVMVFKFYHIFRYQKRLNALLKSIGREIFKPRSLVQRKMLDDYIQTSKISSKIFLSACIATCSFWGVYPFTEEAVDLPLEGWFPWDTDASPNFEVTYAYQVTAALLIGLINVSIDLLISGLIMVVCSQLQVLNDSLSNIRLLAESKITDAQENVEETVSPRLQPLMDDVLFECVVHHRNILEFADEVSFLFSASVLGQFLVSVMIICVTLFELASIQFGNLQFFSLILYLFCMLLEIFLWCYFGNEVTLQSSRLTFSAFDCEWRNCSRKFRRNLLFLMTRSEKALNLYAGGFFTLSLETFVSIVKSSWSYFAVLLHVNNNQKQ